MRIHAGLDRFEIGSLSFERVHVGPIWQAVVRRSRSSHPTIYKLRCEDRAWYAYLLKEQKVIWYTRTPVKTAAEAVQHVLDWEQQP